jgi:hypothetical protein
MFEGIYTLYQLIVSAGWWLTLGSSTLVTVVLASTALVQPGGYPDPFTPYADLKPGQSVTIFETHPCQTPYSMGDSEQRICVIRPNDGIFDRIIVSAYESDIETVTFYGENLQVVDVVRRWGKPNRVLPYGRGYILTWNQGVITYTVASEHRLSYQLPVNFVMLSNYYLSAEGHITLVE